MIDMFGNMEEQQKALQAKLEAIEFDERSAGGEVSVRMNAGKRLLDIKIDSDFLGNADSEQVEDILLVTFNAALAQADKKAEEEVKKQIDDILPGGLGQLFGG